MKTKFTIFALILTLASFAQNKVSIQNRDLLVDGNKYSIKGICYHPIKKGNNRYDGVDFSNLDKDIQLMKDAGINTVRIYVPIDNENFYDKLNTAGMKVIVGIPSYDDTKKYSDITSKSYLTFIEKYKNHPAILMWELGNEYNYHPEWFENNINNWYTMLNSAAVEIHSRDSSHPVATAHGEVPTSSVLAKCPDIDVWGMNIYRWDDPSPAIDEFAERSEKCFYLSESGADSYNKSKSAEDQEMQANATANILSGVNSRANICSGIALFSFTDGWWKAPSGNSDNTQDPAGFDIGVAYDHSSNEEWFGVVDINRVPKKAYDTLKYFYKNSSSRSSRSSQILQTANNTVEIWPNPIHQNLYIKNTAGNHVSKIEVYNLLGEKIIDRPLPSLNTTHTINITEVKTTGQPYGILILVLHGNFGTLSQKISFIK